MSTDPEYDKAAFKMEIDLTPLKKKGFAFGPQYLEKTANKEQPKCGMCACGGCKCEYPPSDDLEPDGVFLDDLLGDVLPNTVPPKTLKELYMTFIPDQKEWNKFVKTCRLAEKKSRNELNVSSNVPTSETTDLENVQRLTDYERAATLSILNELIDKLTVLGANKPKAAPQLNFHPLKVRYHAKIRKRLFDVDTNLLITDNDEHRGIYRFQKLRTLLEHVLKITRDQIYERSTSDTVQGFLSLESKRAREEAAICHSYSESVYVIKSLKELKIRNDKDTKAAIENYEEEKKKMKSELQQEMFRYGVYLSYFKDWAEAEFESEKWDKDEHYFKWIDNELKKCEKSCNTESRVHRDVLLFLKLSMSKLDKDLKRWTSKYDKDIEEKDSEISELKQKRKDLHKRMDDTLKTFWERQAEIQSYLRERAERERREAERKRQSEAAVRIQAWWRGTMVRWEFGKFDHDKKKRKVKVKASKGKK